MPVVLDPKRWWRFHMSADERKGIEPIFTKQCFQCASVIYNMELSGHIATKNDTQRLEIVQKILSISGHFGTNIYA